MLYQVSLTIPANTPTDKPVETSIEIKEQILVRVGTHFPPGCCHLPYVAIYYGRKQIWPAEIGEWISGDSVTIWDDCFIRLPDRPTKLIVKGYNLDIAYKHTITFYFSALPYKVAMIGRILATISEKLGRLLKAIGV